MRGVLVLDAEKLCAAVELLQENSLVVGDSLWGTMRLGLSGSRASLDCRCNWPVPAHDALSTCGVHQVHNKKEFHSDMSSLLLHRSL